jgi:hypothetical protein
LCTLLFVNVLSAICVDNISIIKIVTMCTSYQIVFMLHLLEDVIFFVCVCVCVCVCVRARARARESEREIYIYIYIYIYT